MINFAVIGGGIAGVSAAAELAAHGQTLVLEAEEALGTQATGRSAAVMIPRYGNAVVRALNAASMPDHQDADVLRQHPFLLLSGAGQEAAFEAERQGFAAERVSISEAQSLFPILDPTAVKYAAAMTDAYDLDTDRLLTAYRTRAKAAGTSFRVKAQVTDLTWAGDHWQISLGAEIITAKHVINAAGAWADQIATLAGIAPLGLQPMRRSMARIAAPAGLDTKAWAFTDAVGESWYAKPDAGALLVSPSEEHPMDPHDAWADDMVIAEGLARYEAFVTEPVTRPLSTWAGLRTFAPDRALVIGPDPTQPNFLWCAGQGGYGFQTAPAAARLLASTATGQASELAPGIVAALTPARFAQ